MSHWRQCLPNYDPEQMPEQLQAVDCCEEVKYLWEYFLSMNRRRTSNGFSHNPITEQDLQAWCNRRKIELTRFEYDALDALEDVYMAFQAKRSKKK